MIPALHNKFVSITPPAAIIDNAAAVTATIDTLGFDYLEVFVYFGAMDIAASAMKIQEGDAANMSDAADVTGLVYGTSTDVAGSTSALPSATDDNKCFKFEIDLRSRKRYLDLSLTLGDGAAGTYVTAFGLLSRAEQIGYTASERGYGNILRL
jgi:hypothetical protein